MKICVIPARGGSKRIPKKNIKHFHGKPMIAYSIEGAIKSGCFDRVIVSTDDLEIANIAIKFGAEVPFIRPLAIADDFSTTMDVMRHAVSWCQSEQLELTHVCCIYATAPFLRAGDIKKGLELLKEKDVEFVFSATTFSFPIQRAIKLSSNGDVTMFSPEFENTRSQDLEDAYHDAGQFYWGTASSFSKGKGIFSSNSKCIILPRERVQDIDTPEDWDFAEGLFLSMRRNPG